MTRYAVRKIVEGGDAKVKKGAQTWLDSIKAFLRRLGERIGLLKGKEKEQAQQTYDEMDHLRELFETAIKAATDRVAEARKTGNVKKSANESARAANGRDTMDHSMKEVGAYAQEGKPENRRAFLERSDRNLRKSGEVRGVAYSFVPVGDGETSYTAEEAAKELKRLGINSFYHAGLEYNENGRTYVDNGASAAIGNEFVAIYHKAFGDGKAIAGHEAYHIWGASKARDAYIAVLKENLNMLTPYALQQAGIVDREYFKGAEIKQTLFVEEYFALISGKIHSGKHDADLATMFKDYEAVKTAWSRLVEQNAGKQHSLKAPEAPVGQAISSAKTSIKQIPALFKHSGVEFGKTNIDIGGGKFDLATNYLAERGTKNMVFDPYNRGAQENKGTLSYLQSGKRADTATCANVLNVIAEPAARSNVILEAAKAIKPDGAAYFMVFEGDRSGEGKQTYVRRTLFIGITPSA